MSKRTAMNSINYAEQFCKDRKYLIKKYPSTWGKVKIIEIDGLSILELPTPQILAGFSSYLKYHFAGKVYFRGEKCFFNSTVPSLFRDIDGEITNAITNRKRAFDELVDTLPDLYTAKRFIKEDFRPLLQHYGIRTDWLDLVDNIFVALWFSNNCSKEIFSYIKFFADTNLLVKNLRENHSSLSLRPHCQHGLSATKAVKWDAENIDFSDNLIATVRLPNILEMQLNGYLFSDAYMFPNEEIDNTYKLLKRKTFQTNLDKITSRHGLVKNALGQIK
jgi:hypothetical protein